jgi:hypothetical protein
MAPVLNLIPSAETYPRGQTGWGRKWPQSQDFWHRRIPASDADTDVLKQLALFGCADLLVSSLMMSYGVDPSPGFF